MGVNASAKHDRKVLVLTTWDNDARVETEQSMEIPFSEVPKAISALVGVYGFIDPAGASKMFRHGDESLHGNLPDQPETTKDSR